MLLLSAAFLGLDTLGDALAFALFLCGDLCLLFGLGAALVDRLPWPADDAPRPVVTARAPRGRLAATRTSRRPLAR